MTEKYGHLFTAFDALVKDFSQNQNLEEWRNIKLIYGFFRQKFTKEFKEVKVIRQRPQNKI